MKKVLFSDLFDFQEKSALQANKGKPIGKFPFYTSSQIQSKFLDTYQFSGVHLIFGTGGEPSIHYSNSSFAVSSDCLVAKPNEALELFNPKYVYRYLSCNTNILASGFRGAGLKHISRSYIANISIPLPSFSYQNQIVAVLDFAEKILLHGSQVLKDLDQLLSDAYFNMFSSKSTSYESWNTIELQKIAMQKKGSMRTGPFGSNLKHSEFSPSGPVQVIGLDNVSTNTFQEGKPKFITKAKFSQLKNYEVFPRDLLVALMGTGTTGKSAVVPDDMQVAINTKHLAAITLNSKIANPYYISFTIHSNPDLVNQIALKNKGAVVPGINLGVVKTLKVKIPPISLQDKFERIYRKVGHIKSLVALRNRESALLLEILQYHSFNETLKVDIKQLSFDDQMVDFIEKREDVQQQDAQTKPSIAIRKLIEQYFIQKQFTFSEIEAIVKENGLASEYEYPLPQGQNGLKDIVFELLESDSDSGKSFLRQVFVLDINRDREKKTDNSRIVFEIQP